MTKVQLETKNAASVAAGVVSTRFSNSVPGHDCACAIHAGVARNEAGLRFIWQSQAPPSGLLWN